jgi:enoyl-CoA hydratase/carnithine racemase
VSEGRTTYEVKNGVAYVVFDRPEARNAMTWAMYDGLAKACDAIEQDAAVKVAVFRGAGGEAFVAGTDIQQFTTYKSGEDGIAYERGIDAAIEKIERVAKPCIAVTEGWVTGGGIIIAAACDFRVATPTARFGVPIARTLGNCLSVGNIARLVAHFGPARVKRMLLLADMIGADEAYACGFVDEVVPKDAIEEKVKSLCDRLKTHAPITMYAAKETMRRLTLANLPDCDDIIRKTYGSEDFREGVSAFLAKRKPEWKGR